MVVIASFKIESTIVVIASCKLMLPALVIASFKLESSRGFYSLMYFRELYRCCSVM